MVLSCAALPARMAIVLVPFLALLALLLALLLTLLLTLLRVLVVLLLSRMTWTQLKPVFLHVPSRLSLRTIRAGDDE